jgi:hypothetical protein
MSNVGHPDLLELNLEDLVHNLQYEGGRDRVAEAIWDLMDQGGLTFEDLERDSFSNTSWEDLASKFNLDPSKGFNQLPTLAFPIASLPPTFHREVMNKSAMWLSVYQPRSAHNGAAARVRLFDPVRAFLVHG